MLLLANDYQMRSVGLNRSFYHIILIYSNLICLVILFDNSPISSYILNHLERSCQPGKANSAERVVRSCLWDRFEIGSADIKWTIPRNQKRRSKDHTALLNHAQRRLKITHNKIWNISNLITDLCIDVVLQQPANATSVANPCWIFSPTRWFPFGLQYLATWLQ